MWSWLTGTVLKSIISPLSDVFKDYFSYRAIKRRTEASLLTSVIEADVKNRMLRKEALAKELEWPPFRWLRFFVFFSLVFYYIAIVGDSIFHFSFDIARLPDSVKSLIDTWAGWIIGYFTLAGGQSLFGILNRWLFR